MSEKSRDGKFIADRPVDDGLLEMNSAKDSLYLGAHPTRGQATYNPEKRIVISVAQDKIGGPR